MDNNSPETSEGKPAHTVDKLNNNPYGQRFIFYTLCRQLKYPINFQQAEEGLLAVVTDSEETSHKLKELFDESEDQSPAMHLIELVDWGNFSSILGSITSGKNAILPWSKKPLNDQALKQCFMRSWMNFEGTIEERNRKLAEAGLPQSPPNAHDEFKILFKQYEAEGLTPIEPEQLAGMLSGDIKDILKERPELMP